MKLSVFCLLVTCLSAHAEGHTQRISLSFENASVQQVFASIRMQSGYQFIYTSTVLDRSKQVNVHAKNVSLQEALGLCLKDQPLTYSIVQKTVVIKLKETPPAVTVNDVMLEATPPPPPPVLVKGRVVNDKGDPLGGVSVTVKGKNTGTTTAADGSFQLTVPDESAVLVFTYIGFLSQDIGVGKNRNFSILLMQENKDLETIVVVGYGTQRQKDVTGAVAAVSSKDFNQGQILSPQQSIQGKLAGVNIAQNSGKPGGSATVRVRGGTSLTGSNEPLYVIDGVPISTSAGVSQANIRGNGTDFFDQEPSNPLMTLNPNDIESVSVLKDASATAIYGSRAANGVIVITTKKGSAGKGRVALSVSGGVSNVSKKLPVLTANEYRDINNKLNLSYEDKGANTFWQDEIYRSAKTQDYYLSFTGGSEKTTYRASLGYGNQQGVMLASKLNRTNARVNINHAALNDKLTFDLRLNYGQTSGNAAPVSNTVGSEAGTSMNYESYVFNPTFPVYNATGGYNHVPPYRVNPVSFSTDLTDQTTNNRFIGNLSTTYKILKPLSVNVNLGYTNQTINRNTYISKGNPLGEGLGGYASVQKLQDYNKLLETVLRYNQRFGKHSVDAIGGYSYQYFVEEGLRNTANGFLSDEFKWYSLQAASTISNVSTFKGSNTLISFYSRVNYNFDDRFLVTATIRRDGSSRFGSGNKWGYFPSGSVAWRISREKFFNTNTISDLKLRASYGITGNQEIGNLNSITTLGATSSGYIVGGSRITIVLPQQYANPNLRWEQTGQFDAGVDFGLLNGKIHGTIDYYVKKTTDLLLRLPVPSPTAVSTQLANVGSVQNKGLELELGMAVIERKDFEWNASLNFSRNINKVLSLSNDQFKGDNIKTAPLQGQGLTSGVYAQLITPGRPMGTFWGRRFEGVKNGVEQFIAGDTVIGCAQPDFTFGFSNTFNYKRWSLSFNARGSVGNEIYNLTANNLGYLSNLPGRNVMEIAVSSGVGRDQPKQYSDRWIENGSFLRLDNITLSYNVNVKNTFLSNARVYITAQNLFVITGYSGLDPEVNSEISGTGVAPLGIDYLSYPKSRTISAGVNIGF
ncbi:TonB-dependent receptor [Filimonas effusa]|nr:TonB-dependent receptor [Filimonas effusa]